MELTNRDIATAAWLIAGFLLAMTHAGIRRSVWGVISFAATATKLVIPAMVYLLFLLIVVVVASRLRMWDASLLKDTAIWLVFGGLPLFGKFVHAGAPGFWKAPILKAIAFPELIAFALELADPPLIAMLALLPLIALLVMLSTVAGIKQEFRAQKPWHDGALTAIGLPWLVWTVIQVVVGWGQLDWSRFALMFYPRTRRRRSSALPASRPETQSRNRCPGSALRSARRRTLPRPRGPRPVQRAGASRAA